MNESDITDWYEAGKRILQNLYKDYDYKRFRPFYHGTSSYHIENIKKKGLCPRGETPSVWSDAPSHEDRIYFAQCQDYLPSSAATEAEAQAEFYRDIRTKENIPLRHVYKGEALAKTFEGVDLSKEPESMFIRFNEVEKYREFIDADTDPSFVDEIVDPNYNFQSF